MDDLDFVIDGTRITAHATDGGKLVFGFPDEGEATVTVDGGGSGTPTREDAEKLGGALMTTLRSAGYLPNRASNPQNPNSRMVDPVQGFASN